MDPYRWERFSDLHGLKNTGTFLTIGNGTCVDSRTIFEYDLDTHELIKSELNETN